jgi:chemotaxis response regulator CheB
MVPDFVENFRSWLQDAVSFPIKMAEVSRVPEQGTFYTIPPRRHLLLGNDRKWNLLSPEHVPSVHIPSIDALFRSLATTIPKKVIAILLTGMGRDGAAGLKALRDAGAYTIVQEPKSAPLPSMPEAAIEMNAACAVLTPEQIVSWLQSASPRKREDKKHH